jgi:hypothetical protein
MNGLNLRLALSRTLNEHEDRHYLGMSAIGKCARFLYGEMVHGREVPSEKSKRYFHEGYLHERDVIERLAKVGIEVKNHNRELVAPFDDRLRGHIDGEIEGDLLEIKSLDDERFYRVMDSGRPFEEHVDQVQMYMRYGGYERALLVYKCRNTGDVLVKGITRDERRGLELEQKAMAILAAVDVGCSPVCTCKRCR